jgi:phytoene dehydrogenase-like protein
LTEFGEKLKKITNNKNDIKLIDNFISDIIILSKSTSIPDKPIELMKFKDFIELGKTMSPFLKIVNKYKKYSVSKFCNKFLNTEVKNYISNIIAIDDFPILGVMVTLGYYNDNNAGWLEGGSLGLSKSLENKYKNLGGKIFYKSRVEEIIIKNKCACGIKLDNGKEIYSDIVINTSDLFYTLNGLLKRKYLKNHLTKMFLKMKLWKPLVMVSIGVNKPVSSISNNDIIRLDEEIKIGSQTVKVLWVNNYNYDNTLNPDGKTSLCLKFESNFEYWEKLHDENDKYKLEKQKISSEIKAFLENKYPELKNSIEVIDIATPWSTYRYTLNFKGSYEGWLLSKKTFTGNVKKTIPGLKNFYLSGHWVVPGGGIPAVAKCSKDIIEIISYENDYCKQTQKLF